MQDGDQVGQAVKGARDYAGRGLFVGIICPDVLRADLVVALQGASVAWSDASSGNLSKSINVVRPEEAKGLEFDAVVVLEPEAIVDESQRGLRLLYVALTRATRYLTVVHAGPLLPLSSPRSGDEPDRPPAMVESHAEPPEAVVDVTADVKQPDHVELAAGPASAPAAESTSQPSQAPGGPHMTGNGVASTGTPSQVQPASAIIDLSQMITAAVAGSLAANIRTNVTPNLWPLVLDQLRRELGVSETEIFDLFGDN